VKKIFESLFKLKMGIAPLTLGEMVGHFFVGHTIQLTVQVLLEPLHGLHTGNGFAGGRDLPIPAGMISVGGEAPQESF
jgi:hypothetical protein